MSTPFSWFSTRNTGPALIILIIIVAASILSAAMFLPQQTLWVDETTQMSGLTLNPIEVIRWLTSGKDASQYGFGVPPDRMPPFSYWVGWGWSTIWGLSETAMRWLGVILMAIAVGVIFVTAYKTWGLGAATVAGFLFGLSPNVLVTSVEIRAYPLFLLLSACSFWFFTRILAQPDKYRWQHIAGLLLSLVLAMYTHFYGVVLAGALLSACLLVVWYAKGRSWPIIISIGIVGIAMLGLIPFVLTAFSFSHSATEKNYLYSIVRLLYRLFVHPTMAVNQMAVGIALISAIILGLLAIPRKKDNTVQNGIWLALIVGFMTVVIANFVFSSFGATAPSYNSWMLPGVYLLLAGGLAVTYQRSLRKLAIIAAVLLIGANGFATSQLIIHGEYFAHGPHQKIANLIRHLGSDKVSIVYENSNVPIGYFPLRYEFGSQLPQYLHESDDSGKINVLRLLKKATSVEPTTLTSPFVLVIRARAQYTKDLVRQIHYGDKATPDGVVSLAFKQSENWQLIENHLFVAFVAADVVIFEQIISP